MKKNSKKRVEKDKGITLIVLVITIIVLLILAGVSISMTFNQNGIFSRAKQTTDKYGQAKAREILELVLSDLQIEKYKEKLSGQIYETRLDNKITEIGEQLDKDANNPNYQQVIVEGSIFLIDRNVPKVLEYVGPADGVIITARITQKEDWKNPVATIIGTIKTYSGGIITTVTATNSDGTPRTDFTVNSLDENGKYTISDITEDTTITINATDSNGKIAETKVIEVKLVKDTISPVMEEINATVGYIAGKGKLKVKISATATDDISGVKQFDYTIIANSGSYISGIPEKYRKGTFVPNETIEFDALAVSGKDHNTYTISVTATDNAENPPSTAKTAEITTTDLISVEEAKSLVRSAKDLKEYIGIKVDYKTGENWRIFYYDDEIVTKADGTKTGYFGDAVGTLYLRKDWSTTRINPYSDWGKKTPTESAVNLMKQMNPMWRDSNCGVAINLVNEKMAAGFYEETNYGNFKNSTYSSYAIGGASIEMFMKAYNVWNSPNADRNEEYITCEILNENGYKVKASGAIKPGPGGVLMDNGDNLVYFSSPSGYQTNSVLGLWGKSGAVGSYGDGYVVRPIVPLDK